LKNKSVPFFAFTRHAEEDLLNSISRDIDLKELTNEQLAGKVIDVKISNMSGVCNKCSAGLTGLSSVSGVLKQFSERYPSVIVRVTADGSKAMPNKLTLLIGWENC
jgi:filamentous hemagglutinin